MAKFSLNPDYLAATAIHISTEETRYYLRGVYVTPHEDPNTGLGALMVATDGHRMALFYDREGYAERPAILSLDWKSSVIKSGSGRRTTPLRLFIDDDVGMTYVHNSENPAERLGKAIGTILVEEIDGTFPDFWRVLPSEGDRVPMTQGVDAKFLADVAASLKRANHDSSQINMYVHDPMAPMWVRGSHDDSAFVVMPVRWGELQSGRPHFLRSGFAKQQLAAE
jgi:DNA polymerase-3 subunit beta